MSNKREKCGSFHCVHSFHLFMQQTFIEHLLQTLCGVLGPLPQGAHGFLGAFRGHTLLMLRHLSVCAVNLSSVTDIKGSPKMSHLSTQTCECVTFNSKRETVDVRR